MYMLSGLVKMCRSIVIGSMIRNSANAATCVAHMIWRHWVSVCSLSPVNSSHGGKPMKLHFS